MSDIPARISIDRNGLVFDGKRFPFLVASEEIEVRCDEDGPASLRVTLLAEAVEVAPYLHIETDGDVQFVSEEAPSNE